MVRELMHLTCKGRLREVGLLSLEKRRLMVGIPSMCAKGEGRGDKLFLVLSIERKRGKRHKMEHRNIPLRKFK